MYRLRPEIGKHAAGPRCSYHVAMPFHREHLPDPLPSEPLSRVAAWLCEATQRGDQANPNAMVLATVDAHWRAIGTRRVCKEIQPQAGYLTFFTNYMSRKGSELAANPRAAVVMHWDRLRRQVRLEGRITRATDGESDAYFASRAWQSRIGAWASQQSAPIASRSELTSAAERVAQRFGAPSPITSDDSAADPGVVIARPPVLGRISPVD